MSITVCLGAKSLGYEHGGGHRWVFLNWALGLRSIGCQVIWLEMVGKRATEDQIRRRVAALKADLQPYGLADSVALCRWNGEALPPDIGQQCRSLDAASQADVFLNTLYGMQSDLVRRFRRSALVDIDPGLLQTWVAAGWIHVAPHDVCLTTGETVGQPGSLFPDLGFQWHHTPPPVALDWWPVRSADDNAPFTTISHWHGGEYLEGSSGMYLNDKRSGYLPFLDLPRHTAQRLELALCLAPHEENERRDLCDRGWSVPDAHAVSATPWDYQRYIRRSKGEFSCVKPSCVQFQNAWISDRSVCYLASGKPVVVENTGPSRLFPDDAGILRFRDLAEAVGRLEMAASDYERHCQLARELAQEHFDARKVVSRALEYAMA